MMLEMNLLAFAVAAAMALPAKAQQDAMQDMPGMQMPAPASSTAPPASASSSGDMRGMEMHGTNMSPMQGMQTPQQKPATKPSEHSQHGAHASAPTSATSTQAMPGMKMPMQRSRPTEMQHLHFGNMNGTRPKPGGLAQGTQGMNMASMEGMDMSSMQGGNAPPGARSPDYSDGYRYTDMPGMAMSDHAREGMLLIDQLEYAHDNHGNNAVFLDGQFWYGEDFNKLWLKFEGEQARGKLEDLRTEALWSHAVSAYWSTQLGVREDFGEGPNRTWAAFGVEGLAPYWFETEATFYVGQKGRTAARVQFEYEELITQRLILQPKFEMNLYGKDDPQRGIGSGLSDAELGLRLRYEFKREFAPYVGVVWRQRFGRTADLYRAQHEPAGDLQFVAGFHFWF
jgi:copper resistance protein B